MFKKKQSPREVPVPHELCTRRESKFLQEQGQFSPKLFIVQVCPDHILKTPPTECIRQGAQFKRWFNHQIFPGPFRALAAIVYNTARSQLLTYK